MIPSHFSFQLPGHSEEEVKSYPHPPPTPDACAAALSVFMVDVLQDSESSSESFHTTDSVPFMSRMKEAREHLSPATDTVVPGNHKEYLVNVWLLVLGESAANGVVSHSVVCTRKQAVSAGWTALL